VCALWGAWCLRHADAGRPALRVATVQPVIAPETYQYQGLNPDYRRAAKETVRELSAEAAASRPDLLFWPEGGNGQLNFRIPLLRDEIETLARQSGATLLVSSHDVDEEGRLSNAVFAVSPDGRLLGRYAKVRLTPVAERAFTAGTSLAPLPTPHGAVGTLICWESAFPALARRLVRDGATMLFASTSDASLRHSSLTFLHARAAILRAIETRRPLVQAGNTGPSMIVSPWGEVTAATSFGARTVMAGTIAPANGQTLHTRLGEWPLFALALGVLALALRTRPADAGVPVPTSARVGWPTGIGLVGGSVAVAVLLAAASVAAIGARLPASNGSWREGLAAFIRPAEPVVPADAGRRFLQSRANTCGVAALAQLLSALGMEVSEADLLQYVPLGPRGASMAALAGAARRLGLRAWGERQSFAALGEYALPVIAHVRDDHYVVVLRFEPGGVVQVFDPAQGYVRVTPEDFRGAWDGYVLVVRFERLK
ncbi:MAG TPA: nitrilase-related carbon-nitrogen hydrolase, partial [Candidatus Binatia bacterium]|nr:nitrilase-related carbon-nitrogen hydrolase [Candidatus Binatia bacterium]